jgi:hypothetical protein
MSAAKAIGTFREKSLHAALKRHYAGDRGLVEAQVGQYVCDAVRENGEVVEIQTANFGSISRKLEDLTKSSTVRLIHPISRTRTIELLDLDGSVIRRRKSPRKGNEWDLFSQLVRAPRLPLLPGLTIELVFVDETELRLNDGAGSWRRKGVSIVDRRLDAIRETIVLEKTADYRRFLPLGLPQEFGAKELACAGSIGPTIARRALYVLKRIGLVEETGKRGNAKLYRAAR